MVIPTLESENRRGQEFNRPPGALLRYKPDGEVPWACLTLRNGLNRRGRHTSMYSFQARFNWEDPLLLDQQLSAEERMVRDSTQQFAQDKLAPRVLEAFRHEQTDPAIFRAIRDTGFTGCVAHEFVPIRDPMTALADAVRMGRT